MIDPATLAPRDLRRLLGEMWPDPRCNALAGRVVAEAVRRDRKAYDGTILHAFLDHFPKEHLHFTSLMTACRTVVGRRDWTWAARGERWRLWERDGPARLGAALLASANPQDVLHDAGLDGLLAGGGYVRRSLEQLCMDIGGGEAGEADQNRLIALFEKLQPTALDAPLAYALLNPWAGHEPPKSHRDRLLTLLSSRIGDPRLHVNRWGAVLADLRRIDQRIDIDALIARMQRWFTDLTVRQFFKVVGRTTDDPVQWAARQTFWVGYLDAGLIDRAWFALGRNAEAMVAAAGVRSEVDYGTIAGGSQYANPSHSTLILTIGKAVMAEWSHNGACRFWYQSDTKAPVPFGKQYWGIQLRAMDGGRGFERLSHAGGWQHKFAAQVHAMTGIRHPVYGP